MTIEGYKIYVRYWVDSGSMAVRQHEEPPIGPLEDLEVARRIYEAKKKEQFITKVELQLVPVS